MNQDQNIPTPKPTPISIIISEKSEKIKNSENFNGGSYRQKIRTTEMLSPSYRPMMKSVLIEALYSLIFTHHIPILMKNGTLMDETPLINFNSIADFFTSYFGKIIFFLTIYFTLHYIFLPFIRKIDFP
jgi:hypothetical protein